MLNIRGQKLFPSVIEQVVRGFDALADEFQIVLETEGVMDTLTIVAETRDHVHEGDGAISRTDFRRSHSAMRAAATRPAGEGGNLAENRVQGPPRYRSADSALKLVLLLPSKRFGANLPETRFATRIADRGDDEALRVHASTESAQRSQSFSRRRESKFQTEQVDIATGKNRAPEFLKINPMGGLPVLESDDGTHLAESVAICRYFEALHPEPRLMGIRC